MSSCARNYETVIDLGNSENALSIGQICYVVDGSDITKVRVIKLSKRGGKYLCRNVGDNHVILDYEVCDGDIGESVFLNRYDAQVEASKNKTKYDDDFLMSIFNNVFCRLAIILVRGVILPVMGLHTLVLLTSVFAGFRDVFGTNGVNNTLVLVLTVVFFIKTLYCITVGKKGYVF